MKTPGVFALWRLPIIRRSHMCDVVSKDGRGVLCRPLISPLRSCMFFCIRLEGESMAGLAGGWFVGIDSPRNRVCLVDA